MEVDDRETRQLVADLGEVPYKAVRQIAAVVKRTMTDTRKELQQEASGVRHAPALPKAITYDLTWSGLGGEIGPVTGGAGSLAFLYYGNRNTGPVLKDPVFAMRRNAAKAEPFFLKAAGDVL